MSSSDSLHSTDAESIVAGSTALPAPPEWGAVAVRLLQGVVYHDDNADTWECLLRSVSQLMDYFAKIGLQLIVDEADAMAYLRQPEDDEIAPESDHVPRLFRRSPLTYEATLLCVLLRDELRQFEEEDVQNERCVIAQNELLSMWQAFFPEPSEPKGADSVKLNRSLTTALRKLEDLKFVRLFEKEPPSWEVRRIIKARLPLAELERLRESLVEAAQKVNGAPSDAAQNDGNQNDAVPSSESEIGAADRLDADS